MMDTFELFKNRIIEIKSTEEGINSFKSSAINDNSRKRVYNILNTNVKTINTYSKYINDIATQPLSDHHQKYQILRQLMAYYNNNENPPFTKDEKERIDVRKSILQKAYNTFNDKSSFSRTFITFILALKSGYNLLSGTQYLLDSLPDDLIDKYDNYLSEVLNDVNVSICNPVFGIYVLYSDPDLLDYYLDLFYEDENAFASKINPLSNDGLIEARIETCQKSALRVESFLFSLYLMINSLNVDGFDYQHVIDSLLASLSQKLVDIKFEGSNTIFTKYKSNELDDLKAFLNLLSDEEKREVLFCLGNDQAIGDVKTFKRGTTVSRTTSSRLNGVGYDADTHAKSRRGQKRFKRALIESLNGNTPKCFICGCEICGKEQLIASHILPWGKANSEQKVNPNNGLLLCPNHDFLFDSLLISFDENGKIMISDSLSNENRRGFRIDPNTRINLVPEKEEFMKLHREAFNNKRWK